MHHPAPGMSERTEGGSIPQQWSQLHTMTPEMRDETIDATMEWLNDPVNMSWLTPLMGPTTAVGALIQDPLSNPLQAALEQSPYSDLMTDEDGNIMYDEDGNAIQSVGWTRPDTAQALMDKGMHPLLALAVDLLGVPDPTGVNPARIGELIPLLGLIGPGGLRAMARHGQNVQFIPPTFFDSLTIESGGLRRTPARQTEFANKLANDPRGMMQPVVLGVDLEQGRVFILDGHHRMTAAQQLDRPVPVVAYRSSGIGLHMPGRADIGAGMPIPEDALARLRARYPDPRDPDDLIKGFPGPWERPPSEINPADLGFPVYDTDTLMGIARQHADQTLSYLTEDDLADMADVLHRVRLGQTDAMVVGRSVDAVPDHTTVIERVAMRDFEHQRSLNWRDPEARNASPPEAQEYVARLFDEMGESGAMQYLENQTGLTAEELQATIAGWTGTRRDMVDNMHAGGILNRGTSMPTDPPYRPGEDPRLPRVDDPIKPSELDELADEGARVAAEADAKAAGEAELGRPVEPQQEWLNLVAFGHRIDEVFAEHSTAEEALAALDRLAADLDFENLRSVDRARYNLQLEDARFRAEELGTSWEPRPPRTYSDVERARLARQADRLDVRFGDMTPQEAYESFGHLQSLLESQAHNVERMFGRRNGWSPDKFDDAMRIRMEANIADAERYLDAGDALGLFGDRAQRDLFVGAIDDAKAKLARITEATGIVGPPPRPGGSIDSRVKLVLDDVDRGTVMPSTRAEADALIAEIHQELDEIVSSPHFPDRSVNVDERMILLNEYLAALRRIDPLDSAGDARPTEPPRSGGGFDPLGGRTPPRRPYDPLGPGAVDDDAIDPRMFDEDLWKPDSAYDSPESPRRPLDPPSNRDLGAAPPSAPASNIDLTDMPSPVTDLADSGRYVMTREAVEDGLERVRYRMVGTEGWEEANSVLRDADTGQSFKPRAERYDPEIATAVPTTDEWGTRVTYDLKPGWSERIEAPNDPGLMYRGMSYEEWEEAKRTGVIRSLGDMNIGERQAGLTLFGIRVDTAESYAGHFAPERYQPVPGRPAIVIAVPRRSGEIADAVEVGVRESIPISEVMHVWEGHPYAASEEGGALWVHRDGGMGSQEPLVTGASSISRRIAWRETQITGGTPLGGAAPPPAHAPEAFFPGEATPTGNTDPAAVSRYQGLSVLNRHRAASFWEATTDDDIYSLVDLAESTMKSRGNNPGGDYENIRDIHALLDRHLATVDPSTPLAEEWAKALNSMTVWLQSNGPRGGIR
jgi:hypothetical protein